MTTVVYIGNFRHPFCTEVHVAASLEALGHRVVRQQEHDVDWAGLPDLIDREQGHMLLWTRTIPTPTDVAGPVLAELNARGVPSVSFHLDLFLGLDREHQVHDQGFFHTDLLVTPHRSPRWAELGINHLWQPPGVFHAECDQVPPDRRRFPHDVVFVGSHPYPHPEWRPVRDALIGAFEAEFGDRFTVWPKQRRPLRGRELQTLYASAKVIIGDTCLAGDPRAEGYWSDRVPETLGRGGFLLHPTVPGDIDIDGAWYQHDVDLITYDVGDHNEAIHHTHYALDNDEYRNDRAEQGREKVLGRDTYKHRMETVLAHVADQFGFREPPAPAPRPEPPMRVRSPIGQAIFHPRPGEMAAVDRSVVDEVWTADDYRIGRRRFRGTVVDVGANIGAFTIAAAKAGAREVHAYEPHPANRARLEHHIALNRVGNVTVSDFGLVGNPNHGPMWMTGDGGGAHAGPGETGVKVETIPFADMLRNRQTIEFLKMDIEGGEYDVFAHLTANDLHDHVAELAMEFHGPGMPHLTHLDEDERHLARWQHMIAVLADCGRVEIMGHPTVGGMIWWKRY